MAEPPSRASTPQSPLPQARVAPAKRSGPSAIWLIPIVAAVVAIGIAVNRIMNEGPTISIVFKSVEGIEAGKTVVRYKDVNIGQVTAVELSPDFTHVVVTAKMAKSAEGLMMDDARFWIVQPRVTLSGVSGLGTLLSGNYIGFEPGKSHARERRFVGLDTAPPITSEQPGRRFSLSSADLGSLGEGSPVYFRKLQVGKVIDYDLTPDGRAMRIGIFVDAPYDRFVTADTRFWNASGIDVSIGAGGVDLRTESLISVLVGGVAFDSPRDDLEGPPAPAGQEFKLFATRAAAMKQPETITRHYILYTTESLGGLEAGAPVTLLGLPAGEVTDVGIDVDPKTLKLRGRVAIATYPERLIARLRTNQPMVQSMAENTQESHEFFQRLVEEKGLRAQLRSASLITGKMYLAFDFFPDAPKAQVNWDQDEPVLPMVPSTVPDLESKITGILAKIDALPFEAIGKGLKESLDDFGKALKGVDTAVKHIDTGVTPELKTALQDLKRTLDTANKAIVNTNATMLSEDAPVNIQLRDALQEISEAARSFRALTDYLERQPESLIRGKPEDHSR